MTIDLYSAMKSLGRGAQLRCSYDLRVAPITISQVLRGVRRSPTLEARIAEWLRAQGVALENFTREDV
jgi:hypothetical protein